MTWELTCQEWKKNSIIEIHPQNRLKINDWRSADSELKENTDNSSSPLALSYLTLILFLGYYINHINGPRYGGYIIHVICLIITKMTFLKLKFDHVISLLKILQKSPCGFNSTDKRS